MKNYFRNITLKSEMINDKQHKIEQYFRFFSKPHKKNIRFLFMKIRLCLYERYNRLFSWFRNSFALFRWNVLTIEKIWRNINVKKMSLRLFQYQNTETLCLKIEIQYFEKKNWNDQIFSFFAYVSKIKNSYKIFQLLSKICRLICLKKEILSAIENDEIQK